jgi:hypothetical protein
MKNNSLDLIDFLSSNQSVIDDYSFGDKSEKVSLGMIGSFRPINFEDLVQRELKFFAENLDSFLKFFFFRN